MTPAPPDTTQHDERSDHPPATGGDDLDARLAELERVLDPLDGSASPDATVESRLAHILDPHDRSAVWLALAVLGGTLPTDSEVVAASRAGILLGVGAVLAHATSASGPQGPRAGVRVRTGEVLVDVTNTVRTTFFTGIQRVARECVRHWSTTHDVVLVRWSDDLLAMTEVEPEEVERLTGAPVPAARVAAYRHGTRIVPWGCTYVVPELAAERPRTERLLSMARHTHTGVRAIGFDTVPLTAAETAITGLPSEFAGHLAAARHYQRIVGISTAASDEYAGWRHMLGGVGIPGPDVSTVPLAIEAGTPSEAELRAAADRLLIGDLPLVLVVGSHEPRKNHSAVLHAAEVLWREGRRFALTFIGGNSWNSEAFHDQVRRLQAAGRPLETISGVSDELLWPAYRLARLTVFPSFTEGFGLPLAESLASGTPAITSDVGSMREIASEGGALLVDPRDDHAISDAMRRLLLDDDELARLRAEAAQRPTRTWSQYAAELWDALVAD